MGAMSNAEEKSEAATPKRRTEARRRGQVAKSTDLSSIVGLMGVLMALSAIVGASSQVVTQYFGYVFRNLDGMQISTPQVMTQGSMAMLTFGKAMMPLFAVAMVLGIVSNVAQTGLLWATEGLRPDFNRINPLSGAKRFVSARSFVELAKSSFKIGLIGWIAYVTVRGSYPQLVMMTRMEVGQGIALVGELVFRLAFRVVGTLLVIAALDYAYQRYSFEKSLRMTKEEVKQEHKQSEGSPQLKSRVRARQRELAKKRMMQDVPAADVVITNPTHFAVALKYNAEEHTAPRVVAKGQDLMAHKIRELAQHNDVPIVENPPLARALYKQVDIGREVPSELYEAVAEVLAFVYQINEDRRRRAGL
jgi:flagellar biosynthesis protein FlhB